MSWWSHGSCTFWKIIYWIHCLQTSVITIFGLWLTFGPTRKIFLWKYVTLNFVFIYFFLQQSWPYKKPTAKMLVTFILENKNCKRAWKFLLKTLLTMVCFWLHFLNPWCARTKHILILYKSLQFFFDKFVCWFT